MSTPNERLKMARAAAYPGKTPTEVARMKGWIVPTYLSHENSSRGFPKGKAATYAQAFNISLDWLVSGKGEMRTKSKVPLVGYVGAGGVIMPYDDHAKGEGLEQVDAPPNMGPDTVAVKVRGDSMYPAFEDGDIIYYDQHTPLTDALPLKACVVQLHDGRLMVKLIRRGSRKGHFNLISHNASSIDDVRVDWVAPIKWIGK